MGRKSAGFSLIELLIALVVTLLVSGAVFGLLTAGQGAFRREPQLTERQQSLRQAMTMIQEDVMRAGTGLPPFTQVFANGLNATGVAGVLGAGATDALELLAADPACPSALIDCGINAGAPGSINVTADPAECFRAAPPAYFAFFNTAGALAIQPVLSSADITRSTVRCTSVVTAGARIPTAPGGGGAFPPTGYVPIQVVRYEVAACPAPDNAVPCLYRSVTGRSNVAGVPVGAPPGLAGDPTWQVVARGIEDLQVQYRIGFNPGPAAAWDWNPLPGAVTQCPAPCTNAAAFTTVVSQVQVTLSARTMVGGLQGETTNAGTARVRGQLTGTFTPRVALAVLSQDSVTPPRWR